MTMYYDKRNRGNLALLAPNTRKAAEQWYEYCVRNGVEVLIYETIRTEATQRQYVSNGSSKTMRSYHIVGQALDFVPTSGAKALWDGYDAPKVRAAIAEAKRLGFEWGGDWSSFVDKPHLQFNYNGYGTDKALAKEAVQVAKQPEPQTVSAWAKDAWDWAKKEGLLDGTRPKDAVTREEFAVIMKRLEAKI